MTRSRGAAFLTALLLTLGVPPVWAANESAGLERLDPSVRAAVTAVVDEARRDGLPTQPLVSKAIEGTTKGASGERIVQAVRAYKEACHRARDAMGKQSSEAEIVAAAGALQGGVPEDTLAHLRSARPRDSLVVPLVVLSDLIARSVPVSVASVAVLAPTRAGARDSDLLVLREHVEKDIRSGIAPGSAASLQSRAWLSARRWQTSPETNLESPHPKPRGGTP